MIDLFGGETLNDAAPRDGRSVQDLVTALSGCCRNCRLGQTIDKNNVGLTIGGPLTAALAIVGNVPEYDPTDRKPFLGSVQATLIDWFGYLEALSVRKNCRTIRLSECFQTNVVQCRTMGSRKAKFREPAQDEWTICFPDRTLAILQAMPHLEVVVTLGMTAAAALLGKNPEPRPRTHQGAWFLTDYLPGVAVFVLSHPAEFNAETEGKAVGRLRQHLEFFHNEYINQHTAEILSIQRYREAQRRAISAER